MDRLPSDSQTGISMPFRINDLPQELRVMIFRGVSESLPSNWIDYVIRTDKFQVTICLEAKYRSYFPLSRWRTLRLSQWIETSKHFLADVYYVRSLEIRPLYCSPTTSLFIGASQDARRCILGHFVNWI